MTGPSPYLSFVATSRNDDYGGNSLQRAQVSFSARLEQLEEYRIESEFILVEWNAPGNRSSLRNAISWPQNLNYTTIRIISVPPEIHHQVDYSEVLNINAALALNCGIRRARGQWVLPGNIDLLYSNELMQFVAKRRLQRNKRYRIDRTDVNGNVVQCDGLQAQLEYCRKNVIRVHGHEPRRARFLDRFRRPTPTLHTMACGDFQLLSKEWWHYLRGYSERDIVSAFSDSVLSYASFAAGVEEHILNVPMRLYHIDHENKFDDRRREVRLPGDALLRFRLIPSKLRRKLFNLYERILFRGGYHFKMQVDGIPTQHFLESVRVSREMLAGRRSHVLNDDNWGLGDETLDEVTLNVAGWDDPKPGGQLRIPTEVGGGDE